ncbi:transcription antitermination protein nusG [Magnetococcus marinus MC-1]|uniref:Transcription termination/antitermination protein NusG n=1 Tax=Magnetococcus marinus (strain ATCC BAA-1437 / JCM 17883 / MC-1) TaxID=156889 RepID=A0L5W1_MAGMM|nr:transcription termination/antitermination protein NusG [Magnetococcus marinus]ABK43354.1 transcription antitermination protein nusG [Magnetococcus marinus MC-1]
MSKRWYVIHAYSGFEKRVKSSLEEKVRLTGMSKYFDEILVPSEEVIELRKGAKVTSERKFFPGYVLVKMDLNDETWHLVKDIPKVAGFLGGGGRPQPLSDREVEKILQQVETGMEKPKPKVSFAVGEQVRVTDGPFVSFNGVVEEVEEDKSRLKVSVSIFGRATPVELDFIQVEKI